MSIKRFLPKSEFSKNIVTMLTGNVFAQLIPLLLTPILSRIFSVEEFGLFAFYSTLVNFFLVIAAGRYEMAILLPKEESKAYHVFTLCLSITTLLCLFLFAATYFFEDQIISFLHKDDLKSWLLWLAPSVFVASVYRSFTYWSNRKKRFKSTSISAVSQSTARVFVNLGGGIVRNSTNNQTFSEGFQQLFTSSLQTPTGISVWGMGSLIIGNFIGFFVGTLNHIRSFFSQDRHLIKTTRLETIKEVAKEYDKFPKINAIHAFTDEIKNSGVTFVISYMFSELTLGFYSMTYRVLTLPLSVIGSAFSQVFLQKAAEMHANKENMVGLIKDTMKKLSFIALPIFIPIVFFGPLLFGFVLGEQYRVSGEYAQLLSPMLFLNFIIGPVIQIAVIVGKQKEIFKISLVGNSFIFLSIFSGAYFFESMKMGLLLLTFLQVFFYIWLVRWIIQTARNVKF
jgi:O-antigen/teichoic acid export membrane protein